MPPRHRPAVTPPFDPSQLPAPVLVTPTLEKGETRSAPEMERTLGELLGASLSSEPPPAPTASFEDYVPPSDPVDHPPQVTEPAAEVAPLPPPPAPVSVPSVRPGGVVRYEQRIAVVEAYKFDGRLHAAPEWVDRNWMAYDEGPVLIVIDPRTKDTLGVVRRGDYVAKQDVTIDDPNAPEGKRVLPGRMAVIPAAEFERLYRAYIAQE